MGASVAQLPGGEIVPAMERGVIDGFEFNNPTSDRRFGAQDVAKNYMLGSHHQATEYFEIMFKRSLFTKLPAEQQAILQYAAEATSSANEWKAMDYYSKDLQELISKDKVNVLRTPQGVFDAQIKAWDGLITQLGTDPFMKKVMDSQKEWVRRVVFYGMMNCVRLQGRVQPSLPGRPEDLVAAGGGCNELRRAALTLRRPRNMEGAGMRRRTRADPDMIKYLHAIDYPQHVDRQGVRLAHPGPYARHQLRSVRALRVARADHVGVRLQLHHVRRAVPDGRRLYARAQSARARRRPVSLLASRARRR